MFKLYIYSYFNGIHSSRRIEAECFQNIEVMWLINKIRPNFKTIGDFWGNYLIEKSKREMIANDLREALKIIKR